MAPPSSTSSSEPAAEPHPSDRPWERLAGARWSLVGAVLALILVIDLAMALVRPPAIDPSLDLDSRSDVREAIRHARDRGAMLLLGDSVLAGDVLAQRTDDWQSERVVDHMRREAGPDARPVDQLALPGVLLGDLLAMVVELDELDPEGTVPVAIEVNPRYFSTVREGEACAHGWLCERLPPDTWRARSRDLVDDLAARMPIARHRRALGVELDLLDLVGGGAAPDVDRLEGQARVLAHYAELELRRDAEPWKLFDRLVRRLDGKGREAVFFQTPLNDALMREVTTPAALGRLSGELADRLSHRSPTLVELDHPLFRPEHFVDHCHLTEEGSRLLAVNLLNELEQPLRAAPEPADLAHRPTPDRTLVASLEAGDAVGPGWVARFRRPQGIAYDPATGRLVIADTGNHALRALEPPYQTVRPLAGDPRVAEDRDGPRRAAGLRSPSHPIFVGRDLWFLSSRGARIRVLASGRVDTVGVAPEGTRLVELALAGDTAVARDARGTVHTVAPDGTLKPVVRTGPGRTLTAMAGTQGRLFLADASGRIYEHPLDGTTRWLDQGALRFANKAPWKEPAPEGPPTRYPRTFAQERLGTLVGMDWVPGYDGLLVRHALPDRARPKRIRPEPGDVHWRFVDLEARLVTPWIRPRPFGSSHVMWSAQTQTYASPWQRGSVALDPATGTTFELELDRPRLTLRRDGLLGAAQVSHAGSRSTILGIQELLGGRTADLTLSRYDPVSRLVADDPGRGPYVVLMAGSSMLSMSDSVGQYSLVRLVEEQLRRRLMHQHRTEVLAFAQIRAATTFPGIVGEVEAAADTVRPDLIVVDMWEPRPPRTPFDPAEYDEAIGRLVALRAAWEAEVVVLDTTPFDGLRATPSHLAAQHRALRAADIEVLSLGDGFLEDQLRDAPWATPPFLAQHPTPWALDGAADRLAQALAPVLAARAERGPPAWTREAPEASDPAGTVAAIRGELAGLEPDLPDVDPSQPLVTRDDDRVELLLEVEAPLDEAEAEGLALGALWAVVRADRGTDVARTLRVRLVRFSSYDEYGQGQLDSAETVLDRSFTPEELLAELRAR